MSWPNKRIATAICALLVALAGAAAGEDLDLAVYREGDDFLKPTIQFDAGLFQNANAWFDESYDNAGDHVGFWSEFGLMPGLEGSKALGDAGRLRARVSGVWTTTQFGLDGAGSNFQDRHPEELTLEDAYIGWSSGDLIPSLGKDAIDLSVGAQKYQIGSGFLFWDGGTDGGDRGGYWLGMRKAFELSAIGRITTGPVMAEFFYLKPNDDPNTSSHLIGTNLEWTFSERASLGGTIVHFVDSDLERRDDLDLFDARGTVRPLDMLPGLELTAEFVYETNDNINDSMAGYVEIGHHFDEAMWTPYLSYRFAGFTGDDKSGHEVETFDPMFYGFSDWSTWYAGEIFGNYVGSNRGLEMHTVRGRIKPCESVTVNAIWLYYRLEEFATDLTPRLFDPRVVNIEDKDLGHETNLVVDWAAQEHLLISALFGALVPGDGLEQAAGGDETWFYGMLYASVSF